MDEQEEASEEPGSAEGESPSAEQRNKKIQGVRYRKEANRVANEVSGRPIA